jgi:RimJ/RimL family protein N-acetyltransferase
MIEAWVRPVVLEGSHVRLEPMRLEHADAVAAAALGHGLFRYFPVALETRADLDRYVAHCVDGIGTGASLTFVTRDRASGRVAGSTAFLAIEPAHRRLEIGGTWLAPAFQRTPCNTEAKYLQLRHCFESLGCLRVEFKTDARNQRSRAALARIGAVEEGTFRSHMVMPDGALRDSVYFSVIASEWPAVKARLESLLGGSTPNSRPGR